VWWPRRPAWKVPRGDGRSPAPPPPRASRPCSTRYIAATRSACIVASRSDAKRGGRFPRRRITEHRKPARLSSGLRARPTPPPKVVAVAFLHQPLAAMRSSFTASKLLTLPPTRL
jgi:hypothetical protein